MPFSKLEKEGHFASQNPGCKSTRLGGRREAEPQSLAADNNGLQEHREAEEPEGTAGTGRNTTTHTVRPD